MIGIPGRIFARDSRRQVIGSGASQPSARLSRGRRRARSGHSHVRALVAREASTEHQVLVEHGDVVIVVVLACVAAEYFILTPLPGSVPEAAYGGDAMYLLLAAEAKHHWPITDTTVSDCHSATRYRGCEWHRLRDRSRDRHRTACHPFAAVFMCRCSCSWWCESRGPPDGAPGASASWSGGGRPWLCSLGEFEHHPNYFVSLSGRSPVNLVSAPTSCRTSTSSQWLCCLVRFCVGKAVLCQSGSRTSSMRSSDQACDDLRSNPESGHPVVERPVVNSGAECDHGPKRMTVGD